MARAEPDTSIVWTLNTRHCGRLKHIMTKWIGTNSQECTYGPTHYKLYSHGSNDSTERLETLLFRTSRLGIVSD